MAALLGFPCFLVIIIIMISFWEILEVACVCERAGVLVCMCVQAGVPTTTTTNNNTSYGSCCRRFIS